VLNRAARGDLGPEAADEAIWPTVAKAAGGDEEEEDEQEAEPCRQK
jgi:hypothetical protein